MKYLRNTACGFHRASNLSGRDRIGATQMPEISYSTIEDSFYFASASPDCSCEAYISLDTGQTYWISDLGDSDELPDDFEESDRYLQIPSRYDLGLGTNLVRDFAAQQGPRLQEEIERIFQSRGAYRRFKVLLAEQGLLETWYEYENERTKLALKEWCLQKGIVVDGSNPSH